MANVDRANGFRPVKSLIGAPWTSLVRSYPAVSGRTPSTVGDIYIGSVVSLSGGNVAPAASGGAVLGVVVAVGTKNSETALNTDNNHRYFDPDNLSKRYLAYDEDGYVGVVPAEACLFEAQAGATTLDGAVQGQAADFIANEGSRTTGNSTVTLTGTATNSDVTIVEHVTTPNNDVSDAGGLARFIVKFNKHANPITA